MRSLNRQKQAVWFTRIEEVQEGIDTIKQYSKPEKHDFTVSSTSGTPEEIAAGIVPNYDRYITSYDRNFHPKEGDGIFVDITPELDADGSLIMLNESGEIDPDGIEPKTPPDYTLKKIIDTKKGSVARYGIKKEGVSGGEIL